MKEGGAFHFLREVPDKGAGKLTPNRRQVKELHHGIDGRTPRRSQGGGKPRPYHIRLGVPFVYSRGDPCGPPGGGARLISTIMLRFAPLRASRPACDSVETCFGMHCFAAGA